MVQHTIYARKYQQTATTLAKLLYAARLEKARRQLKRVTGDERARLKHC